VVPVPAVEERRAIIGILGALDDKIAANDRVIELEMRLVRDLARQYAGIETFPLSGITSVVARGRAPKYVETSDCMVVNQKCVRNGLVDLAPARFTAHMDVGGDRALRPLDVLINSTGAGTLGRVGIWNQAREATIDSHVTLARVDPERANPAFVAAQLIGRELAFELLGEGSTGQTELARGRVLEFPVSLPDRQTQDWAGDQIRVLLDRVQASAAETRRLAVARDALLPELMSGRLGVLQSSR
jgi:type I restriction enzyme S subunit